MNDIKNLRAPQNGARKLKNDIILIAAALLVAALAALGLNLFRAEGGSVSVTLDGKPFGEYSLFEDREVEIRSGDGYNLLVIKDGAAWVAEASCPDGICAAHRPVSYGGQSIICLPNKVVVEIHSKSADAPDVIA